jgi:hypothetical protein
LRRGWAFDAQAVGARVAVVDDNERRSFKLRESAGDPLSVSGTPMFGERFARVVAPDDPAPLGIRFNVDA